MPRHTLYQIAARLDAVDAHAHITTGAHAGSFGANDLPTPTIEQAKADDYVMGRTTVQGIAFAVEQPQGSFRRGVDQGGKEWECRMAAHYGYFTGTVGADGDGVDGFIGPFPEADTAYVINQRNQDGSFDEHKLMCGFKDERHAREAYLASYERGWTGLGTVVPLSISQLRWWLEKGDTKTALTPDQLPQDGRKTTMTKTIAWNDTLPEGHSLDQVLYEARRMDGADGLLLDSLSMADIMEDADSVHLLDALVVEYAQVGRIAERLRLVMDRSGGTVKAPAVQVSEPFKARGVTNVAAVYELSDGQTVSIFFHNPDTTPNKLATGDELVSWKWLLNKKDITIVVAPEKGQDLNPRTVAQRIMKLAEKNSAAFQKANVKRAERLGTIQTLRDSIAGKEAVLKDLGASIEAAKFEKVQREGAADGKVTRMGRDFYANKLTEADASDEWFKALDSTAGDAFKAALEIYRSKLQGTFVNTVVGKVLFTGKGGSEVRGWARQRPLLAETVPFIPAILRSATTYKDEDLDKDRKGDFDFFRRFSGTQKLPSGFTVEAVVKVGVRTDGEMFYHLRAEQIAMDDAKESAPDSNETAGADQKVGSPDLLDGYSSHLPMDSIGGDDDGVNLEIVAVWDADGNKVSDFDAQAPVALVDAAYQFANATDAFKERVAGSVEETNYSPFASAKAMDMKAKELGAEIHWGMGPMLDSVGESDEDEDFDAEAEFDACPVVDDEDGEALDGDFKGHPFRGNQHKKASSHSHAAVRASMSAKHAEKDGDTKGAKSSHKSAHYSHMAAAESTTGKARRYHRKMAKFHGARSGMTLDSVAFDVVGDFVDAIVGKIMQGGELKGRAVIGGDGKAMVFVGESDDQRVQFKSSRTGEMMSPSWSEDGGAQMIEWLLNAPMPTVQGRITGQAKPDGKNPVIESKGTPQELIDIYQEVLPSFEYLKGIGAEVTKRVFIYRGKNVVVSSKGVNEESGGSVTVVDYLASEYWPPNGPYQKVEKNSSGENYAQVGVFDLDEDHDTYLVRTLADKFQTESWKILADLDRKLDREARLGIDKLEAKRDVIFEEFIALANEKSIQIFQKIKDVKSRASEFLVHLNDVLSDYETTARRQMDDELTYARQGTYSPEYLASNREASLSAYFSAHRDAQQAHEAALAEAMPKAAAAPVEVYAFKDASAEALGLLQIGAQNTATHSTYKTAVSVEKAADANGMTVRWEAVSALPTFDDATGGLFGDGDSGYIRGALSYNGTELAKVYVRDDGMAAFELGQLNDVDSMSEYIDMDEEGWAGWNSAWADVISELHTVCDKHGLAQPEANPYGRLYDYEVTEDDQGGWWARFSSEPMSGMKSWSPERDEVIAKAERAIALHKASPYIDRRWNSPSGRVKSVKLCGLPTNGEGSELYEVKYSDGSYRRFPASHMDRRIAEDEFNATPEGIKAAQDSAAKHKREQAEREAAREAAKAEDDRINAKIKAFTDSAGYSSRDAGKAREVLKTQMNYVNFGGVMTRLAFVDKAVAAGSKTSTEQVKKVKDKTRLQYNRMDQREQDDHEEKQKAAGTKTEYSLGDYTVTKAEYDYANYLIGKTAKSEPEPQPEVPTVNEPTKPTESTEKVQDRAFLMSVIDGTNPEILEPELVPKIEAAYQRNSADVEMVSLFSQAVNAYTQAMLNATAGV